MDAQTVLAVLIGIPVAGGLLYFRWKMTSAAHEYGRRHQLDPGPARLTLGLSLCGMFLVMGVLGIVLPDDPWSLSTGRSAGIPYGVYSCILILCGLFLAVQMIRHRNPVVEKDCSECGSRYLLVNALRSSARTT